MVCQVVTGLGGVGKTQLAAELAHRYWDEHLVDLLVWVTATSRSNIISAYSRTAAEISGVEDPDPEQGAARLLAWLAATDRRWLIVLDDLADPGDLRGLWPPVPPVGRTVVTTRRRDTALLAGRHVIALGLFTPVEADTYLTHKLAGQPHLLDGARELACDLGFLPLGLAQAAAYLLDRNLSCTGYRTRLADRRRRLADLLPDDGALPDDHQATVAATWALSIELADALKPAGVARPLIELAALLDPNGIPATVFDTDKVAGYVNSRVGRPVDAEQLRDGLQALHRLSLLTADTSTGMVRVHALVQRAVRDTIPDDRLPELAAVAADSLLTVWPDIDRDPAYTQTLYANTTALHTTTGDTLLTPDGHTLLFHAPTRLGETGQVNAAITAYQRLFDTCLRVLGPDHPHTLTTRSQLARWRGHAGDPTSAATAYEQLLADRLRVLGPDHPDTLTTRHNLAYWRGQAGDPAGAATAFEQLLADRLRVLGPDHPHTLTTRSNLARWRGEAGDPAGAATAFEQLLDDYLRVLGPDHPDTLTTRHNLAYWRGQAGDPAGAATASEQLLDDYLRVLGPDHPDTLTTRHNLAYWRGQARR
ncbi:MULTISPECIES: tetratricopeptide repeat protein [unclassified Actinoplanes]|uniref:tetratricopeptide repeat protein n=1 Tax=unclassified Actinoplanes TaxID=2626549 RepID=UPI001560607C|nr:MULTISPECIES: tetratricopeptide repeat protein [unclassified Actinoplanes]